MEEIFKKYPLLKGQNVPRETLIDFEFFISMLQKKNKTKNYGTSIANRWNNSSCRIYFVVTCKKKVY